MSLLYCFFTHQKHLNQTQERVAKMLQKKAPYLVIVGGYPHSEKKENTLYLSCDDTYPGLPEKLRSFCRYIQEHPSEFETYAFFVKLDEDMIVRSPLRLPPGDYMGKVERKEGNRRWHLGKCPGSVWNHTPYTGVYVPWCLGGCGYILSKKAIGLLSQMPLEHTKQEIYEDLMVAKWLFFHKIYPREIPLQPFLYSPVHT